MTKERKKLIFLFLIINLSVLSIAFFYNLLFKNSLIYDCVFLSVFGFYCPGCGGTRAAVALLYGQIGHSLKCNPLTAYIAAGFLALDIRAAVGILRRQPFSLRIPLWYFWVMLAIAVIHCIVRNVLMITVGYDYLGDLVRFWHP